MNNSSLMGSKKFSKPKRQIAVHLNNNSDNFEAGLNHPVSDKTDEMSSNPASLKSISNVPKQNVLERTEAPIPNETGRLLPSGTTVYPTNMMVDTSLVTVWKGNTRYGTNQDVSDIEPDIRISGTNQTPVWLRPLNDGSKYEYELIYGTRRLQACINACKKLTAEVCQIDDRDAFMMMMSENMRSDPSNWLLVESYHYGIESGIFPNQESLASNYNMTRETMNKLLAVMELPKFFREYLKVGSPKIAKTKIRLLGSLWRKGREASGLSQDDLSNKLQLLSENYISKGLNIDIQNGMSILQELFKLEKAVKQLSEVNVNGTIIKLLTQPSGSLTINVPASLDSSISDEITTFIKNLDVNKG